MRLGNDRKRQLREDQPPAFRLRHSVAKLFRGIDPEANGFLHAGESRFLRGAVRGAAGEFRRLGDECGVFPAPISKGMGAAAPIAFVANRIVTSRLGRIRDLRLPLFLTAQVPLNLD